MQSQSKESQNTRPSKTQQAISMESLVKTLDMNNQADLLLATREDLLKCKMRDTDISDHTINQVYAQAALNYNLAPRNAFEDLMREMNGVLHFTTGVEELDKHLKEPGISSDELVEVCGQSGSGKTYFCLKMASLALLEQETAVIYIDTTNYVNQDNMNQVLRNFITTGDAKEKGEKAAQALGRLRVIKCFDLDTLFVLMSMILTQLSRKQMQVDLRLIFIDSLSSLFSAVPNNKQHYFQMVKEVLYFFKCLTKKHQIGIVYTNNTKDASVTRVTDLKNLVNEPLSWAVDKQIFANQQQDGQTNYVLLKH